MTKSGTYNDVYLLLLGLSDRASDLSDEQHTCLMHAFNVFVDAKDAPPVVASLAVAAGPTVDLWTRTSAELGRLVRTTSDGPTALRYAYVRAVLTATNIRR